MSLNVTFTCNEVVDEDSNVIECNYKAYYVRQGVWNDTRTTDHNQYNFNAGDADSLGQDGELKNGDAIIVCLWQDELDDGNTSSSTSGNKTRFATFSIVHDGSNTYVIDAQLKPKMVPTCNWSLTTSQVINESYTAHPSSDDEDSWSYDDQTFYHRRDYYSELIFDSVGVIEDTYDFTSDGEFVEDATNVYTSIDDFTARHKAVNGYDLEAICDKTIRTYYHTPLPDIVFSPDTVLTEVYFGQDLTVEYKTFEEAKDEDTRVIKIDTKLDYIAKDGSIISTDNEVLDSTDDVTSTKTIEVLSRIDATMTVYWNDGWDDVQFDRVERVMVENTLPITDLSKTDLNARYKRFSHVSSDIDGEVDKAKFDFYLLMPFGAGWTLVESHTNYNDDAADPYEVTFSQNGTYKAILTVTDNASDLVPQSDGTATSEMIFDISLDECTPEAFEAAKIEEIYFIFPDINVKL